jgi:hypothetical protein
MFDPLLQKYRHNSICSHRLTWFEGTSSQANFLLIDHTPGQVPVSPVRYALAYAQVLLTLSIIK